MTEQQERRAARDAVLDAARRRAAALAAGDEAALEALLHPAFLWTTHTGQRFDRQEYVERNTGGTTVWRSQELLDAEVAVAGDTAVLTAVVKDIIVRAGEEGQFEMPVTMTWVFAEQGWRCLAGHAGPRL